MAGGCLMLEKPVLILVVAVAVVFAMVTLTI